MMPSSLSAVSTKPEFSAIDHQMMARAIKLANKGRFTTAPNPNVGCVLANGEEIVGEGFHYRAGEPHAEVHAIASAGDRTRGATAYVTLEPCSHYGRTPPCAEGLIKAQVKRVVCAMTDPNPQVAGRGIKMLREAGIQVDVGLLEQESRALNPAFLTKMETGRPFVQLKMAASLDGQTALSNGKSQWITSAEARQDVQRFRAMSGAILSTSRTVIDDSASLAVRWNELPISTRTHMPEEQVRQPARVILDRQHQLMPEMRLFQQEGQILTVASSDADIIVEERHGQLDLPMLLDSLATQHGITQVWVEAGATLARRFIEQQLVDELIIYLAPKIMGSDGRGLFGALGLEEMAQVFELDIKDVRQIGKDIRITAQVIKTI